MKEKSDLGPVMDYASPQANQSAVQFRFGMISLVLSLIIAAVVAGVVISMNRYSALRPSMINLLLTSMTWLGLGGCITGGIGLFQPRGRMLAIIGLVISIAEVIAMPMFMVA